MTLKKYDNNGFKTCTNTKLSWIKNPHDTDISIS